jgi:4-nitrophenyl phosphatase
VLNSSCCLSSVNTSKMSKPDPKRLSSKEEYSDLISKYETFLFDCDGVLWSGDDLIPGATDVLEKLRSQKKRVIFVTNNATKSRKAYKGKFDKLKIPVEEVGSFSLVCKGRKNE